MALRFVQKFREQLGMSDSSGDGDASADPAVVNARLVPTRNEIRILTLHPGKRDDPIRCTLRRASLGQRRPPRYNALSYTWGDTVSSRPLAINGAEQRVTENLESALRHLRGRRAGVRLWVDALCINQRDAVEQAAQVRKMGEIYSKAESVVVWLGDGDEVSDFVMETARKLARSPHSVTAADWYRVRKLMANVLGRDYFRRVWVIQEFLLARNDPLIYCGHFSISWTDLVDAMDALETVHPEYNSLGEYERSKLREEMRNTGQDYSGVDVAHARMLFAGRWKFLGGRDLDGETNYLPIADCLAMCSQNVASKSRDYVYGVIGLMAEEDRETITISCDETTPVMEIYRQAFVRIWMNDPKWILNGRFFAFASGSDEFPSWVPDLSIQKAFDVHRAFRLVNQMPWRTSGSIKLSLDGKYLTLQAFFIDSIKSIDLVEADLTQFKDSLARRIAVANTTLDSPIPKNHHLYPLAALRSKGSIRTIFTDSEVGEILQAQNLPANIRSSILSAIGKADWDTVWSKFGTVPDDKLFSEYPRHRNVLQTIWDLTVDSAFQLARRRGFLTTDNGLVGIGTAAIQPGDHIVFIPGSRVPFVLRPKADYHCIVGYARVSGFTEPSLLDKYYEQGLVQMTKFRIG